MSFGELAYKFFNTAGIGGIMVTSVIIVATSVYIYLTRWILNGGKKKDADEK